MNPLASTSLIDIIRELIRPDGICAVDNTAASGELTSPELVA